MSCFLLRLACAIRYGNLRDPDAFGRAKTMGLLANKDLARGMLEWTKTPLHTTLTVRGLDPEDGADTERKERCRELKKLAVGFFKNVLGFMGDRIMPYPAQLAQELIAAGYKDAELRDELYCQVNEQELGRL